MVVDQETKNAIVAEVLKNVNNNAYVDSIFEGQRFSRIERRIRYLENVAGIDPGKIPEDFK